MRFLFLLLALASTPLFAQNCTENCGSISGRSWFDMNRDGIRQEKELPVPGRVALFQDRTAQPLEIDIEEDGTYAFNDLAAGTYIIEFLPPTPIVFATSRKQGDDPTRDSDVNAGSFEVEIDLAANQDVTSDADIGWLLLDVFVRTLREPSCANPSGDYEVVSTSLSSAELTINGESVPTPGDTLILDELVSGNNEFTVSFAGNSASFSFVVPPATPPLKLTQTGSHCTDSTQVHLAIEAIDFASAVSYQWSDGSTDSILRQPVVGQRYDVTVSLDNGCDAFGKYVAKPTKYVFPQPSIFRLDCATGLDTITLPESFYKLVEFQLREPGSDWGASANEFIVDRHANYAVRPAPGSSCAVSGGLQVVDGRLAGLSLREERIDPCLLDANYLFVDHPTTPDFFDSHEFSFRGPADSIVPDRSTSWFADLYGAQPGTYSVDVTSECGDTTLSTIVATADTCKLIPNVSGVVSLNEDGSCNGSLDDAGPSIPRVNVNLTNDDGTRAYLFQTDDTGYWEGRIPPDTYRASAAKPQDGSLLPCPSPLPSYTVNPDFETKINLAMAEVADCASLNVDVTSPRFRVCFDNRAYVSYANRGGEVAENTVLEVTVDSLFDEVTATETFTRSGDVLTFDLADLPALGRGQLRIDFKVNCDAIRGQLHCIKAEISSDNACNPGDERALVDVTADPCDGDSTRFNITNIGTEAMANALEYFVYVNTELDESRSKRVAGLEAGETLTLSFPATGSTVQVVARQATAAGVGSAYPSAIVEGCGGVMTGSGVQISSDNGFAGRSIYCRTNTGSFDPNEKLVFPVGLGEMGDVPPGTRLTYELHYQNTGTDTAFTVVIRDTLPVELDIATIDFGTSSHDYRVRIDSGRVLIFTFDNILLVDSFTNVTGSMGVVKYKINHVTTLERGDQFRNRAGIYFDFNDPVITEYARTRIEPLPSLFSSLTDDLRDAAIKIELFPNPVGAELRVELPELKVNANVSLRTVDVFGRTVGTYAYPGRNQPINVSALPTGPYVLVVESNGQIIGRKQFMVAR
ncbi:DUF7619 domain-containing protein [Neolewinella antarctica]|uniref:Repeat protein (TIGR01451 family) n=1 Tax=Neolewinella antarctica TaxID=442734 RepID=A0ABX0XAF6_9BACT|nr:SdrD B-like domain-containing protein [Neolewinella antarctica]NJC25772.1 putative repeat protein (TIGR01451 family) [Neolewinella antarctica]